MRFRFQSVIFLHAGDEAVAILKELVYENLHSFNLVHNRISMSAPAAQPLGEAEGAAFLFEFFFVLVVVRGLANFFFEFGDVLLNLADDIFLVHVAVFGEAVQG